MHIVIVQVHDVSYRFYTPLRSLIPSASGLWVPRHLLTAYLEQ